MVLDLKTILFTNHYSGLPLEIVRQELPDGFGFEMLEQATTEALAQSVGDADYILAGGRVRIDESVLCRASKLKMIQRSGVGLDSLDLEALRRHGIPLYVNRGVNAQSVAEHALLLMLACLRRLPILHRNTVAGVWKKQEQGVLTSELHGKTVGLIGMGNIARVLVGLLKGFGVRILYYDAFRLEPCREQALGIQFTTVEEMLPQVNVLSLHCPLTEETRGMINSETLALLKPDAILVNTARGGLVDAAALAAALREGRLAFAGLDVHEEEPLPVEYPLKQMANVILTPHIGGVTADSFRGMMSAAMRNILLFDQGRLDEIASGKYTF